MKSFLGANIRVLEMPRYKLNEIGITDFSLTIGTIAQYYLFYGYSPKSTYIVPKSSLYVCQYLTALNVLAKFGVS
ncbi:unnamed protein product [Hermetia illucens]|uniref:Uncharacterized protein n=1 Tax=Hermetia illucens TaxID=343691 RepID=A0A7R8UCB4_HERIL|nr:unnamed protein product [Hermetia illucens]